MSLYVFACAEENGVPDLRLLSLMYAHIKYERIFFSPECARAGQQTAEYIGAEYAEAEELSLKKNTESRREYVLRIKKEGSRMASLESNNILFLPPENVKILCGLKEIPPYGYSEVI